VPVDEVPRPTRSAVTAAEEVSEDGGSTVEMPVFDDGDGATLDDLIARPTLEDASEPGGDGAAAKTEEGDALDSESVELEIDDGSVEEPVRDEAPETDDSEPPAAADEPGSLVDDDADEPPSDDGDDAGDEERPDAEDDEESDEESAVDEDDAPAPIVPSSVVVVSRTLSIVSAPGAKAPPPLEPEEDEEPDETPDTLVGAELDDDEPEVFVEEEVDEPISAEVELEIDSAETEVAPDALEEAELAEALEEELLEEAEVEALGQGAPSKPPPPPSKAHAPPPPPSEAKAEDTKPPPKPAASKRPKKPRRNWWETLFNDDYLRTVPIPHPKTIIGQCDFIEQRLGLAAGATILDVGCGLGLHAVELTRRGYLVVGLDLSLPMLSRAADEAQEHGFKINFLHADMREMNFEGAFDAVVCWGTTFGYFDDEGNRQVVERLYRALKPRGLLLMEAVNRDYVIQGQPNLVWFEGDGCVVMEETHMNYITSRLGVKRTVILDDGRQRDTRYSVRLYSLHELGQILHHRGFRVVEVSGREAHPGVYFGADSPKLIILAERRPSGAGSPAPPTPGGAEPPAPPSTPPSQPAPPPAEAAADEEVEDEGPDEAPSEEPEVPPSEAVNDALAEAIEQSEEELGEELDEEDLLEPVVDGDDESE